MAPRTLPTILFTKKTPLSGSGYAGRLDMFRRHARNTTGEMILAMFAGMMASVVRGS